MGTSRIATRRRGRLLLLGAFAAAYLLPLGVRPLFIPDEYRYAEIPREMRAGGDWIAPHLVGFLYFEKPVLTYWVSAASQAAFGEDAFAVRLPSALAAGLCALLTALLVRRAGEGEAAALLAAAVWLSSALVFGVATHATTDAVFTLCLTLSLVSGFLACEGEPQGRRLQWALAGAAAGAAFLAKGFLGFGLPAVVLAPYLTWQRGWRAALRHAWIAPVLAIAVALPWSVAIALRDSDFWSYFVWTEHIRRFASEKAQHRESWWYYGPVLLGGAMPWVPLWPAAAAGLRARLAAPLVRYALCWMVFPLALFSLSSGKLGGYILPCFPALAILTALGLRESAGSGRALRAGLRVLAAIWGAAALGLTAGPVALAMIPELSGAAEPERLGLAAIAALAASIAFEAAAESRIASRSLVLAALAPLPLLCVVPFVIPEPVLAVKAPGRLLAARADRLAGDALLASQASLAPTVAWFAGRTDVYLLGRPGELGYGAARPDSRHRVIRAAQLRRMIAGLEPGRVAGLVARRDSYDAWSHDLPAPSRVESVGDFVYSEYGGGRGADAAGGEATPEAGARRRSR